MSLEERAVVMPDDQAFRTALREVLTRSGRSMRQLSAAMGRDPGYIAALLDPTRPSRARPTPADLLAASDATGIPFVELLQAIWGIDAERLARELGVDAGGSAASGLARLTRADRRELADFARFLAARRAPPAS
jgi:hypothetical protein